jgi:hypothetical protein
MPSRRAFCGLVPLGGAAQERAMPGVLPATIFSDSTPSLNTTGASGIRRSPPRVGVAEGRQLGDGLCLASTIASRNGPLLWITRPHMGPRNRMCGNDTTRPATSDKGGVRAANDAREHARERRPLPVRLLHVLRRLSRAICRSVNHVGFQILCPTPPTMPLALIISESSTMITECAILGGMWIAIPGTTSLGFAV